MNTEHQPLKTGTGPVVHYLQHGMTACMMYPVPSEYPEGDTYSHDWKDVTCTSCLNGKELIHTFTISADRKTITCLRCKMTSHNPNDVEFQYCGHCHVFHDDIWPPARRWWIDHPNNIPVMIPEPEFADIIAGLQNLIGLVPSELCQYLPPAVTRLQALLTQARLRKP